MALAVLLAIATPAFAARELVGLKHARFTWSAASGPVSAYRVYIERNYGQFIPSPDTQPADDRTVTINGDFGEVFRVQVAAIAEDGREGPRSNPSEYIQFKSPPASGDPSPPWTPTPPPVWTPPPPWTPSPPPGSGPSNPPASLARPDFNGDGVADLLLREEGGMTLALFMSGDGPKGSRFGQLPLTSAIVGNGDYDGDGHSDLLTRDDETGAITLQLLVKGVIVGGGTVASALSPDWELCGSGDFDGNGRDDILVRNTTARKLEIWFMSGPHIVSRATLNDPFSSSWQVVGVADVSRDKLADIFWYNGATNTAQVSLFGSWLQIHKNLELFRANTPGDVVALGDADGNGLPDLVVAQESGELRVWLTTSDWSGPKAPIWLSLDAGDFAPEDGEGPSLAGLEVQAAGDFDGDQRLDLLMRNTQTQDLRVWFLGGASVEDELRLVDQGATWVFEGVGLENSATHR